MRGRQDPIRTKSIEKFAASHDAVKRLTESNQSMKELNCNQDEGTEF